LEIAVDGAVNKETITQLLAAGANRFAPGSAVSKALDPALAYKQLAELIGL
jgi:pentose-5-phosphate-3-epimerase